MSQAIGQAQYRPDRENSDQDALRRRASEAGLVVLESAALNAETPLAAQVGIITPNAHFYLRNHFPIPRLDPTAWRLTVGGLVERPLALGLSDLLSLPSQTQIVTLECAGNGRSQLDPPVEGEQWKHGAASAAEWTGVPLAEVLSRAGVSSTAQEVVFRGADGGSLPTRTGVTRFERSLRVDQASQPEVLLAYAMNGEPLPVEHGYPLRLVVPDWYAMASVKWLAEIEVVGAAFSGYFQATKYVYEEDRNGQVVREPVTRMRVRALIAEPGPGDRVAGGSLAIRGLAWSGVAPIDRVEVSVGYGPWQMARLGGEVLGHAWRRWELMARVDGPGPVVVRARATDLAGHVQPDDPAWNRLGYGNNAIQSIPIEIV